MAEVRKNERFYIHDPEQYFVQIEPNNGKLVNCFLHDISISGACIILDKQVFLQRGKDYPVYFLEKKTNGEMEQFANQRGKIVWYLPKDFRGIEMQYLGIEFLNTIVLPEEIMKNVKGNY